MRNYERCSEVGLVQESIERRAANRESSAGILTQRGIAFTSKNGGAHLIIEHGGRTADFWPGTGKYIVRGGGSGRGVFNLLRLLGKDACATKTERFGMLSS